MDQPTATVAMGINVSRRQPNPETYSYDQQD